ncbi:MAG: oligoendopeptidase F [Proteobacteria bacterium]|nr:oligoendopeptidase F [Pseudomonadota bacterium]
MAATSLPDRKAVPAKDQWDLSPLFATMAQWEFLFENIAERVSGYTQFKGKLHESFSVFIECLDFDHAMGRDLEKIYTYAHLRNDEDTRHQVHTAFYLRAMSLHARISDASSFIIPEIHSLDEDILADYLENPKIKDYRFYLEKILRNKPHTRSKEVEQVLAMESELFQSPRQIFSQLDNADFSFGTMTDNDGNRVELSHGNFISFLSKKERPLRKKTFKQYYKVYEAHKHGLAATLAASVKKDVFISRARKFDSCLTASLFQDKVDQSVYDNLISTVKDNLSPLFNYLEFRKKALNISGLHIYDTHVPLVNHVDFSMDYDEAVTTCIKALSPLGSEYTGILEEGLRGSWVDRYENRGKRSGAYSSGCYDSMPYILMNYRKDAINSLYTLAHEAGHSMHSYYSRKHQPYASHGYTIFVAEVASTLNETLLSRYLLEHTSDPRMKAYIINREIDNIRGTLFRQTMFAEFEKIIHERAENNEALTLKQFQNDYRGLLETYFGKTLVLDDELSLECLRIPHFYSGFYVYKYATGISAALSIAARIMDKGKPAVKDYLKFLKLGGSMYPLDELRIAGVDMNSPGPIVSAIDHFRNLVQELKGLWTTFG